MAEAHVRVSDAIFFDRLWPADIHTGMTVCDYEVLYIEPNAQIMLCMVIFAHKARTKNRDVIRKWMADSGCGNGHYIIDHWPTVSVHTSLDATVDHIMADIDKPQSMCLSPPIHTVSITGPKRLPLIETRYDIVTYPVGVMIMSVGSDFEHIRDLCEWRHNIAAHVTIASATRSSLCNRLLTRFCAPADKRRLLITRLDTIYDIGASHVEHERIAPDGIIYIVQTRINTHITRYAVSIEEDGPRKAGLDVVMALPLDCARRMVADPDFMQFIFAAHNVDIGWYLVDCCCCSSYVDIPRDIGHIIDGATSEYTYIYFHEIRDDDTRRYARNAGLYATNIRKILFSRYESLYMDYDLIVVTHARHDDWGEPTYVVHRCDTSAIDVIISKHNGVEIACSYHVTWSDEDYVRELMGSFYDWYTLRRGVTISAQSDIFENLRLMCMFR